MIYQIVSKFSTKNGAVMKSYASIVKVRWNIIFKQKIHIYVASIVFKKFGTFVIGVATIVFLCDNCG